MNEEFLNFAKSLPMKGCTIGILSNLTPETSKHVKKNLLENFDYHFYSNLLKMSKPNSEIYACVGPCIGKKSYEVNLKFYKNFIVKSNKNKIYFSKKNKEKKFFNLRKYVSDKLVSLKVKLDHINFDTFSEKSKFFSYRRSFKLKEKDYGRCISVIYLSKFSQN